VCTDADIQQEKEETDRSRKKKDKINRPPVRRVWTKHGLKKTKKRKREKKIHGAGVRTSPALKRPRGTKSGQQYEKAELSSKQVEEREKSNAPPCTTKGIQKKKGAAR